MIQVRKTSHCWMKILIRTCHRRRITEVWFLGAPGFDEASLGKIPEQKLIVV
jgi:hypothetical protein